MLTHVKRSRISLKDCPGEIQTMRKTDIMSVKGEPEQKTCHGSMPWKKSSWQSSCTEPVKHSSNSEKISLELNPSYELPIISQKESYLPSGIASSIGNQPILTKLSCQCTIFNLMKRERGTWEMLRLCCHFWVQKASQNRRRMVSCILKTHWSNYLPCYCYDFYSFTHSFSLNYTLNLIL